MAKRIINSTYRAWANMKTRCSNPKCQNFADYGGRGIVVCDRWKSFDNFLLDMGEKPDGLTLDRIDNDGNYEPDNCRWATRSRQANNRRGNHIVFFNGKGKTLNQHAIDCGLKPSTVRQRFYVYGWGINRCLTPTKKRGY